MADGTNVAPLRDYAAVGARLGLEPIDVEATLFLAARGYYRGTRGPGANDPLISALRKHAAIVRAWHDDADALDTIDNCVASEAADVASRTTHRRQGTRPRRERRAEQRRRDALEAGQLWFCGLAWSLEAVNDEAESA